MRKQMMNSSRRAVSAALMSLILLSLLALAACGGQVNPQSPDAQLSFGIQMARQGLWSEAVFRFKQAERMDPGEPRILNNMAVAYEALGQFDLALETYQRALKASPSNSELKRNYSRFVEFYRNFRAETEEEATATGP